MSYTPHLREGQPAQRRVSYRRLTDDSNGLTGDDESAHVVSLGIEPPASRGRGNNEVREKASVREGGEEFGEDLMVNIYSSPLTPTSIRDEIWFSIRYCTTNMDYARKICYNSTLYTVLIKNGAFAKKTS